MEDKRAFERFDLRVPAKVGVMKPGQEKDELSLISSNICAGGAFLLTEESLPSGTRVKLDLILSIDKLKEMLDSHCRIKVEGEVIRSEEGGVAVRFDEDYEIMPVKGTLH